MKHLSLQYTIYYILYYEICYMNCYCFVGFVSFFNLWFLWSIWFKSDDIINAVSNMWSKLLRRDKNPKTLRNILWNASPNGWLIANTKKVVKPCKSIKNVENIFNSQKLVLGEDASAMSLPTYHSVLFWQCFFYLKCQSNISFLFSQS